MHLEVATPRATMHVEYNVACHLLEAEQRRTRTASRKLKEITLLLRRQFTQQRQQILHVRLI